MQDNAAAHTWGEEGSAEEAAQAAAGWVAEGSVVGDWAAGDLVVEDLAAADWEAADSGAEEDAEVADSGAGGAPRRSAGPRGVAGGSLRPSSAFDACQQFSCELRCLCRGLAARGPQREVQNRVAVVLFFGRVPHGALLLARPRHQRAVNVCRRHRHGVTLASRF